MAVTGSGINTYRLTASGDSLVGNFYVRSIRVVMSGVVAGNSVLVCDANGSANTLFKAISDVADYYTDGWAVMKHVRNVVVDAMDGNSEVYVDVVV